MRNDAAWAITLLLLVGCPRTNDGDACESSDDCETGLQCADEQCVQPSLQSCVARCDDENVCLSDCIDGGCKALPLDECDLDDDCSVQPSEIVCHNAARCAVRCDSNSVCTALEQRSRCDPDLLICQQCLEDADCGGRLPFPSFTACISWGAALDIDALRDVRRCGCATDQECVAEGQGDACVGGVCSCSSDSACGNENLTCRPDTAEL